MSAVVTDSDGTLASQNRRNVFAAIVPTAIDEIPLLPAGNCTGQPIGRPRRCCGGSFVGTRLLGEHPFEGVDRDQDLSAEPNMWKLVLSDPTHHARLGNIMFRREFGDADELLNGSHDRFYIADCANERLKLDRRESWGIVGNLGELWGLRETAQGRTLYFLLRSLAAELVAAIAAYARTDCWTGQFPKLIAFTSLSLSASRKYASEHGLPACFAYISIA